MLAIGVLVLFCAVAWRVAPRERKEDAQVHGAGQIGLLAAVALLGVDYFTSYYYATGELMSALHPCGLQKHAYLGVVFIALADLAFGALYLYATGVFNERGGSYTASMRYLTPFLSLVAAVVLIEDSTLTIVVSALSGGDQLLSILNLYGRNWVWHFLLGAALATVTWYLTIRGRGDSSFVTFILLGVFVQMTVVMAGGLVMAVQRGVPPAAQEIVKSPTLGQAIYHMLTATMKVLSPSPAWRPSQTGSSSLRMKTSLWCGGASSTPRAGTRYGSSTAASRGSAASCRPRSCSTARGRPCS